MTTTLGPPPPPYPADQWADGLLIMNACIRHGVMFRWSPSMLLIPLRDIETVLLALPPGVVVGGFDGFRLEGYRTYASEHLIADFGGPGPGPTPAEALAWIPDWPRDKELWVELVIGHEQA